MALLNSVPRPAPPRPAPLLLASPPLLRAGPGGASVHAAADERGEAAAGATPCPRVAEGVAVTTMDALVASPFALLDTHGCLRFVTDIVHEDDALCLALACRAMRDAL